MFIRLMMPILLTLGCQIAAAGEKADTIQKKRECIGAMVNTTLSHADIHFYSVNKLTSGTADKIRLEIDIPSIHEDEKMTWTDPGIGVRWYSFTASFGSTKGLLGFIAVDKSLLGRGVCDIPQRYYPNDFLIVKDQGGNEVLRVSVEKPYIFDN